jgi:Na+/phosphate symporter
MAGVAQGMVRDAIDAFVRRDAERAQQVIDRDDEVDELYHVYFRDVLAVMVVGASTTSSGAFTFSPSPSGSNASATTPRTWRSSSSSW